jgi:putative colanic acid biosynthesis glycosyltransferase
MSNKLKVLQVGVEVNKGSTGRIAEQIGILAQVNGFESYIAYARGYNPSKSKTIKIGNYLSILLHLLRTRLLGDHLNGSWLSTLIFIAKVKKLNPDIIHLHNIHGYYINFPLFFKFLDSFKKPVVWSLHDCWAFTGHCPHFYLEGCFKWKKECHNCPKINKYPSSLFFDRSKSSFRLKKYLICKIENICIVSVSEWIMKMAKQSFIKDKRNLFIYNGVDTSVFKPINTFNESGSSLEKIDWSKKILLAVGTEWNSKKGLDDYIRLSRMITDDYLIVLLGANNIEIDNSIDNIILVKRTESIKELASFYSRAHILLCLSKIESFGLTVIEAFACGTPAIVYDNSALAELVTPQVGIKVETSNLDLVLGAINEITNNGKLYYKDHCIEKAKREFDINITYQKYIDLYKKLITNT